MTSMTTRHSQLVEQLENRMLLSGNVTALLQSGNLLVRGDGGDNQIVISRRSDGTTRITGRDATTVNGHVAVTLGKITHDVTVKMQQGGADRIVVSGRLSIPGSVNAALGAGEVLLDGSFGPLNIGGDLTVKTGADGLVNVRDEVVVAGRMTINSGGDANVLSGFANLPNFSAARFDHGLKINNPYFPIVPGTTYTYRTAGVDPETDEPFTERNIVQVTSGTKVIAGVRTRVVHDRVFNSDGTLKEDTLDHYAQDNNGNVWYFGEDVTNNEYNDSGKLIKTDHEGTWTAGVDNAQAGIVMEAAPRVGTRYYQEFAPANDVLDTGVGLSTNGRIRVPAGRFQNLFRTEETTVIEPFALANKLYAPGVGTVMEFEYDPENNAVLETVQLESVKLNGKTVSQVVSPAGFVGKNSGFSRFIGGGQINGQADITTKGPFVANRAIFNSQLNINSQAEAMIIDSQLNRNASISSSDVALRGVFADGTVAVGGRSDVFVFDSQIQQLKARFGSNNNDLTVQNSIFGVLDADGGGGHDTFNDRGGNVFGNLALKNFELLV